MGKPLVRGGTYSDSHFRKIPHWLLWKCCGEREEEARVYGGHIRVQAGLVKSVLGGHIRDRTQARLDSCNIYRTHGSHTLCLES